MTLLMKKESQFTEFVGHASWEMQQALWKKGWKFKTMMTHYRSDLKQKAIPDR